MNYYTSVPILTKNEVFSIQYKMDNEIYVRGQIFAGNVGKDRIGNRFFRKKERKRKGKEAEIGYFIGNKIEAFIGRK